ncbi:hypothetical protein ABL840_05200 [Variovorax sp. NFACC27]|uniref:hypothetical protein n=1 Tax=unclassified Variovorax TaxID=663243 RepID=UPI00089742AC|nr:hypothetical protein [Variovorax sp. YR750]SEF19517.1 hypothetical protein SAMN03159371_00172 [Variovorax sp. NFACC28]SEF70494.1 hypothetical protein SAMN03159365_00646 [Variovorax sp. NFACC29]SFB76434.1 hypothetical protein SAMN03159379_00645 [Variovorax sp. NFACC26]SFG76134.1 hypothetical protein SAMN03159447_04768 [Variovorax sp. NFACC27]SEM25272.1 methylaspartate ammonia-lyase [Variovorax sp. YR750]
MPISAISVFSRARVRCAAVSAALACAAAATAAPQAGATQQALARESCEGLRRAVSHDQAGVASGPLFLASYRPADAGRGEPPFEPALAGAGFTYDNAVAGIALLACGERAAARRIGDAVVRAVAHDQGFSDGRVRNAYRAGPVAEEKPALPGRWDAQRKQWIADAYQVSTATGNVAWAALLMLNLFQAEPSSASASAYLETARKLLAWTEQNTRARNGQDGYNGGRYGWDNAQRAQTWKSTEHNIDIAMAAAWAARAGGQRDAPEHRQARTALDFVSRMWSPQEQRFYIGTKEDGATLSTESSGLDAQLWPLLAAPEGSCAWTRGLEWVEKHHRFEAGYGFSRNPDGIWTEGSAQAAATLVARKGSAPEALWQLLASQRAGNGLYYATPASRISTGLAIGPDSAGADFYYYHWPHLGATAWIALAATGFNPFTGKTAASEATPSCPA